MLCCVYNNSIDGVVVCEEFEEVLLNAWQEEEEQAEKRKAEVHNNVFRILDVLSIKSVI